MHWTHHTIEFHFKAAIFVWCVKIVRVVTADVSDAGACIVPPPPPLRIIHELRIQTSRLTRTPCTCVGIWFVVVLLIFLFRVHHTLLWLCVSGKMCLVEYGRITMYWSQRITNVIHEYNALCSKQTPHRRRNLFERVPSSFLCSFLVLFSRNVICSYSGVVMFWLLPAMGATFQR